MTKTITISETMTPAAAVSIAIAHGHTLGAWTIVQGSWRPEDNGEIRARCTRPGCCAHAQTYSASGGGMTCLGLDRYCVYTHAEAIDDMLAEMRARGGGGPATPRHAERARVPGLTRVIEGHAAKIVVRRYGYVEGMARAFLDATGIPVDEAVLVEEQDGMNTRWWFERRDAAEERP